MYENVEIVVHEREDTMRVDRFIRLKFPDVSRRTIHLGILEKNILVNGRIKKKGELLKKGDRVLIKTLEAKSDLLCMPHPVKGPRVIYEDDALLALYKPPFMHTLPASRKERNTLGNFAVFTCPGECGEGESSFPLFLSRLDYVTSGAVLMARSKKVLEEMRERQARGEIGKIYFLIVEGEVGEEVVIKNRIITTGGSRVKVDRIRDYEDETYFTRFQPDKVGHGYTLLRAEIKRGRMHQIRAHAAFAGFPILGDIMYGGKTIPEMSGLPVRPLLHSSRVDMKVQEGEGLIRIHCPLPEDLVRMGDLLFHL